MVINEQDLLSELQNDPAGLGYKDPATGQFKSTREIVRLLCSARRGPDTADVVPDPPTPDELLAKISAWSLKKIPDETLVRINELAQVGDVSGIQRWLSVAKMKDYITQAEHDAIATLLGRTKTVPKSTRLSPRIVELGWGESIPSGLVDKVLGRAAG